MSSIERELGAVDDADMARAVAFIDGAMDVEERARFELRLAAEPALASAVEALMSTDELVRRAHVRAANAHAPPARDAVAGRVIELASRRRRTTRFAIASLAAAVLVAFGLVRWLAEKPSRSDCVVALAPSFATPEAFLESRPELAGLRPPGLGTLRGATDAPNIAAQEFVAKASALEPRPVADAAGAAPITAGYFVIPIEARTSSSVVVLGFPRRGASLRFFPELGDSRPVGERGRVEPGAHTLPRERIELASNGASASVEYHRGFLVPVGAGELDVLVGVRREALDDELLAKIDQALKRGDTSDAARAQLERRGFEVTALRVIEPKD